MSKQPNLNDLYNAYIKDPSLEVGFSNALYQFVEKTAHKKLGKQFNRCPEIVGDSVSKILHHIEQFRPFQAKFTTWATTIVYNMCVDAIDEAAKRKEYPINEYVLHEPTDISRDERLTLKELLKQLSDDEQQLVDLKFQGYENVEIGGYFGESEAWAKTRYNRITEKLKLLAAKTVP